MKPHNPFEGPPPALTFNLHDGSDEQVSIIIVHRNQPTYLNIALQTITCMSMNSNKEIIVVDNNSTDQDAIDYLKDIEQQNIKVIRNSKNLFWGPAANKGAEAANKNSKYFVFMHTDVNVLSRGWLDLMINVTESENSGLIGLEMTSYSMDGQRIEFISEWCMMVTRTCWEEIGPFPEELPQIGTSFVFTLKAEKYGFNPQILNNPVVHHYETFSLDVSDWETQQENSVANMPGLIRKLQTNSL